METQAMALAEYDKLLQEVLSDKLPLEEAIKKLEDTFGPSYSGMFVQEVEEELRRKV